MRQANLRHRISAPVLAALIAATTSILVMLTAASPAHAFQIKPNPNTNLDGKIVLSPAAERITTDDPEGGKPIGPGMTVTRYVLLQNRAKKRTKFTLDISQVVGSNADDIVEVRHGIRESAAGWVLLERNAVELNPGDMATIKLTIAIPKGVKPGSKAFAISATQASAPVETEGAGVTPIFRQVAIFIVDLPGTAPIEGEFTRLYMRSSTDTLRSVAGKKAKVNRHLYVGKHELTLVMEYTNGGERLLTPQGEVEVRDLFDRVVARYPVPRFTVYPEGAAAQQIELRKLPKVGIFRVQVVLSSDAGQQKRKLPRFLLIPSWLLWGTIALVVLIVARVAWGVWQRRRYGEWLDEDLDDESLEEDGEDDDLDFDDDLDDDDET